MNVPDSVMQGTKTAREKKGDKFVEKAMRMDGLTDYFQGKNLNLRNPGGKTTHRRSRRHHRR